MNPAEDWLVCRLDDPATIRLMRNQHGNWDVMLRIDGGYSLKDAHRVVDHHRIEVTALFVEALLKLRRSGDAA